MNPIATPGAPSIGVYPKQYFRQWADVGADGGGGGAPGYLYRPADTLTPEVIERANANGTLQALPAGAWAFSPWTQHMTAAQFGAADRILAGWIHSAGIGFVGAIGAIAAQTLLSGFVTEIGTGLAAAPPSTFHQIHEETNVYCSVITADAATQTTIVGWASRHLHTPFYLIPASTPIAFRTARSIAAAGLLYNTYSVWYGSPLPTFALHPFGSLGLREVWPSGIGVAPASFVVLSGVGAWVLGAAVNVVVAPYDLFVESIELEDVTAAAANRHLQGEAYVNGALAARFALANGFSGSRTAGIFRFNPPFEVPAGDTLSIAVKDGVAAVGTFEGTLQTVEKL